MRCRCLCLLLLAFVVPPLLGSDIPADVPQVNAAMLAALQRDAPAEAAKLATANQTNAEALFTAALLRDVGAGVRINHDVALQGLERAAETYPLARRYLAWRCEAGFGRVKADPAAGARWRSGLAGAAEIPRGLDRWLEAEGATVKPQFKRALLWMFNDADTNRIAQANLADIYLENWWISPDPAQHLQWLQKAADNGEASSCFQLAAYYEAGVFVEKNPARALTYRTAAANAGDANAQLALAEQYLDGDGVEKSATEALKWLRQAAVQDNLDALVKLADLLRDGADGVPADAVESLRLARRAAELGSAEAMADVAAMLRDGRGTKKDVNAAQLFFQRAAAKENAYAMDMLGWMSQHGEMGAPDLKLARKWYEQSARAGNRHARQALGLMLLAGDGGEKDPQQAFEWFERGARDGDAWCQNEVGWMLRQGLGIERDDEEAVDWFRLAAKQHLPLAEANLGYQYLTGGGVPKDFVAAATNLMAAARQIDDAWVKQNFAQVVWQAPVDVRPSLRKLLEECIADPGLMSVPGALPEMCLDALDSGPVGIGDPAAATALIKAMVTAKRPQADLTIAWHAYLGKGIPFDPKFARLAAAQGSKLHQQDSARLLAIIDSVCDENAGTRERARATLHNLADHGDRGAAAILAERCLTGAGETFDLDAARRFEALALPGAKPEAIDKLVTELGGQPRPPDAEQLAALMAKHADTGGNDHQAIPIYQTAPRYPVELRKANVEGEAQIAFKIDPNGIPVDVHAVKATHPLFRGAAEEAVSCWRFISARKDGKPVASTFQVPIVFNLTN